MSCALSIDSFQPPPPKNTAFHVTSTTYNKRKKLFLNVMEKTHALTTIFTCTKLCILSRYRYAQKAKKYSGRIRICM